MRKRNYDTFSTRSVGCFFMLIILLQSCHQKDADLYTPDVDGHGHNLTRLGLLTVGTWHYSKSLNGYNVSIYLDQQNLSSTAFPYTEDQQKLLFKLYENGKIKFNFTNWGIDTSVNHSDYINRVINSYRKLDKEGNLGSWQVNFTDSALILNFEKNEYSLPVLKTKMVRLTNSSMALEETSYFDSIYNNKKVRLKKVVTLSLDH